MSLELGIPIWELEAQITENEYQEYLGFFRLKNRMEEEAAERAKEEAKRK